MAEPERLIPKHGGYRRLKSFQVAPLVYEVTVRFPRVSAGRVPGPAVVFAWRLRRVAAARPKASPMAEGQDHRQACACCCHPALPRRALLGLAAGAIWATAVRWSHGGKSRPLRPPGALDEPAFLGVCTRCGACEAACPTTPHKAIVIVAT